MPLGCDVMLKRTIGRKDLDLFAEAFTVDQVDDTDVDRLQFLAKSVSEKDNPKVRSEHERRDPCIDDIPSCTE